MARLVVTIDGPAGSGKSTAARLLANKLGASFLDTGAMYRAVTLAAMHKRVDMSEEAELIKVLDDTDFRFESQEGRMVVFVDGEDVTELIRRPEVTEHAKFPSSSEKVRDRLVKMQRDFAQKQQRIVTEGRDQGTVAFADADVKFFLTANVDERARRRQAELLRKGINKSIKQIRKAIEKRDKSDENRTVGPLKPAEDAIVVDTTYMDVDEVVEELLEIVKKRCS
jgi:cytidylate kinase